jgi:hypothetical protein
MSGTITSADLDRAKVASFDRGYREGYEAARTGLPYGSTGTHRPTGKAAPAGSDAASWDAITASLNASLPPHARIPGKERGR